MRYCLLGEIICWLVAEGVLAAPNAVRHCQRWSSGNNYFLRSISSWHQDSYRGLFDVEWFEVVQEASHGRTDWWERRGPLYPRKGCEGGLGWCWRTDALTHRLTHYRPKRYAITEEELTLSLEKEILCVR